MTPFQELKQDIRKVHPQARVLGFVDFETKMWSISAVFNAITEVVVTGISYEDFSEDFLSDDLLPAILDQREGGHSHEMTYKQAKELTKALQS